MLIHAKRKRLHALVDKPCFKRAAIGAGQFHGIPDRLFKQVSILANDNARDAVAMAIEKLSRGMDDEVHTEEKRLLQIGGGKCIVDGTPPVV